MEFWLIYFAGVAALVVAYGVWFRMDDGCASEELLGIAFIAVWIWPLTLPVVLLFHLGIRIADAVQHLGRRTR